MATVAEPTAKCINPAISQARMIGFNCDSLSKSASTLPIPLPTRISLNAPPAPIISRMPASGGKHRWVRLRRSPIARPRRRPSDQ
ncbi:hypothetical protein D3C84_1044520 [compost metagenome]